MFNVIVFMICYLDDKKEPSINNRKEILIKIIPEIKDDVSITPELGMTSRFQYNKNSKIINDPERNVKEGKLSFIFESFSTKVDLNKVKELIYQNNKSGYHLKAEIIKLNYLDIGILAVNYLLENYYKTKMEISNKEGEQLIQFKVSCDLEYTNDSNGSMKYNNFSSMTPEVNSFFTSPLIVSKHNINRPNNFYNYNKNYNSKVLNIFYGIEKSPIHSSHKRGVPSFSHLHEIEKTNKRFSRHYSQDFDKFLGDTKKVKDEEKNTENQQNEIKIININSSSKNSKKLLYNFSFKQIDFNVDSPGSFKSENVENADISKDEENNICCIENEKIEENVNMEAEDNKVLIFENQKNKEFISILNDENEGEYTLEIIKDVDEEEKKLKSNDGKCDYKVLLINMGSSKEIKYAETICENKGEKLIYGYNYGPHTRLKEKNNVKFDKRFDLSLSYEGIVYALKQLSK